MNEIAFNSSLVHEMRAIAFVQRLPHGRGPRVRGALAGATIDDIGVRSSVDVRNTFR